MGEVVSYTKEAIDDLLAELDLSATPAAKKITTLSADIVLKHPAVFGFLGDTFVAGNTEVEVDISVAAACAGIARYSIEFVYGVAAAPGGRLRGVGRYAPPIAGATSILLGNIGVNGGDNISRKLVLSGLTVGQTYTWKLTGAAVSAYGPWPVNTPLVGPYGMVCTKNNYQHTPFVDPPHQGSYLFITEYWVNRVRVVAVPHEPGLEWGGTPMEAGGLWEGSDQVAIPVGDGPFTIALTPNHRKAVVNCRTVNKLDVIDTQTLAKIGSHTVTGNTGLIHHLAIAPDNETVWVTEFGGRIIPVNIVTGVVGTPIMVDAGVELKQIAIESTGTYAFVIGPTKLYKINLGTGAIISTPGITGGTSIVLSPDQTMAYVGVLGAISRYRCSDLAYFDSLLHPQGNSAVCNNMAIADDGKIIYSTWDDGWFGWSTTYATGNDDPPPLNWDDWAIFNKPDGTPFAQTMAVALTPQEGIVFTDTAIHYLAYFPGSRFMLRATSNNYHNEHAQVIVTGVEEP